MENGRQAFSLPNPPQDAYFSFQSFLHKKYNQCNRLWRLIHNVTSDPFPCTDTLHRLINTAYILEEHIHTGIQIFHPCQDNTNIPPNIERFLDFYSLPELSPKQIKYSNSLIQQLYHKPKEHPRVSNYNFFSAISDIDTITTHINMTLTEHSTQPKPTQTTPNESHWVSNLDIESLSSIIEKQIKQDKNSPDPHTSDNNSKFQPPCPIHSQHIRFNMICHREVSNNITTLQLFKSFLMAIRHADSSAVILPFMASKQH